jgi:cysteine/glycine-rich protein
MSKFGGGGTKCKICDKTSYPAETITFEKIPYHADCFRCKDCNKKMEGAAKAAMYEEEIYCHQCFKKGGFAQKQAKQRKVGAGTGSSSAIASKFGGGGVKCTICEKTVYAAEQVNYEKKPYHAECFKCTHCSKKMNGGSDAAAYDDKLYCRKCFKEQGFANKQAKVTKNAGTSSTSNAIASRFGGGGTKCHVCTKTVYSAEQILFEKQAYHSECFKCMNEECKKKITPSGAEGRKIADGTVEVYCKKCFQSLGYHRADKA